MLKISLVALLILGVGGTDPIYRGPNQLGDFDVRKPVPIANLVHRLGPPKSKGSPFCYSFGTDAFLRLRSIHEQPESAGEILISGFPNCISGAAETKEDFREWKTPGGVGIGSSEEQVLTLYGKPTKSKAADSDTYASLFPDQVTKSIAEEQVGERVLLYNGVLAGLENSWTSARFGIRDKKVIWILLTIDD
jgi:hypothetical protein